jgi:protocatechuate 3,4-dioxygenase beta subunit
MRVFWKICVAVCLLAAWGGASVAFAQDRCTPTKPDSLGPFYVEGAPERSQTGRGLVVSGTVKSQDCRPLAGAQIEWWAANARGDYDDAHRATQRADGRGAYRYETDVPGRYPGRPPHLHVKVTAPGHRPLVTQVYPTPGQSAISFDLVLAKGT